MTEEANCNLSQCLVNSSFSLQNVTVSLSADSSHTVPVMYGVALGPPQPLLQGHDKAEKKREIQMQMQVSFFGSFKIQIWAFLVCKKTQFILFGSVLPINLMCAFVTSWVHLHGILDHPRGHQRPHSQRNQTGQGCHAVWHKVSLFYRLRSDADHSFWTRSCILCTIWTISMPNIEQEKPHFGRILLSAIKMFPVNCEQWHNVY